MARTWIAVFALVLGLVIVGASRRAASAAGQVQDIPEDPIVLFAKLMPVFTSPRCANCHGLTDPFNGRNHSQRVDPQAACDSCHTAEPSWRLAPTDMRWAGSDTRTMCWILSDAAVTLRPHFQFDRLIKSGFAGKRADAVDTAVPPPMTQAEFLKAYDAWLNEGGHACSGWTGVVKTVEIDEAQYTSQPVPMMTQLFDMNLERVSLFTLGEPGEDAQAKIDVTGSILTKSTMNAGECRATNTTTDQFTHAIRAPASVRTKLFPDGRYIIKVIGPAERTRRVETIVTESSCLPFTNDPPETLDFDWDPWTFTIEGQLADPRNNQELVGSTPERRTTFSQEPSDPTVWLLHALGVPLHSDGVTEIAVKHRKEWALRRINPIR